MHSMLQLWDLGAYLSGNSHHVISFASVYTVMKTFKATTTSLDPEAILANSGLPMTN